MSKKSPRVSILETKLKASDGHVKKYVTKLESEIAQLHGENARLKVENMSLKLRVKSLQSEIDHRLKTQTEKDSEEVSRKAAELALELAHKES